jgi:uncharacterized protein
MTTLTRFSGVPVLAAGVLLIVATAASAQSFDCRNAELASERAVCAHQQLGDLDEHVDRLYSALMRQAGSARAREDLRDYQLQFLSARDACGRNASCIKGAYLDQIEVLSAQLRHAANDRD